MTASNAYITALSFQDRDKNLLERIARLHNCLDSCIGQIATAWSNSIRDNSYPSFNTTLMVLRSTYTAANLHHNLDQMMSAVRESVRALDRTQYPHTLALFAILSQYHEAVTNPSGSYESYTSNMRNLRNEWTRTMSLAELEW